MLYILRLLFTANPAVIIQSQVQYVLSGSSTTLEATILASPAESAVVQWYHRGRLIDDVNEAQYTATSSGDIRRLRVDNVSSNKIGEYTIVVIVNGMNATDGVMLAFPGRLQIIVITELPILPFYYYL